MSEGRVYVLLEVYMEDAGLFLGRGWGLGGSFGDAETQ